MTRLWLFCVCLSACMNSPFGNDGVLPAEDLESSRIKEGTAEAYGVLAMLNDESTTQDVLDVDARLDLRAARSLIAHRDGPDRLFGTADDNPFDDIAEVDAQYYVGGSALARLLDFAQEQGWIPEGPDYVGQWEGVPFTMDDITATLKLANDASPAVLDRDVGLDIRAVQEILFARPIADMNELAEVKHVGPSALRVMRDYAVLHSGAGVGEDCATTSDCSDGLVCLGEINWGTGIFCVDDSMYGDFGVEPSLLIPSGGEVVSTVEVSGLASVPVDVVLSLDIDHPRPADLVVTVEHFLGYQQVVWQGDEAPPSEVVIRAFPSDDAVNGTYTLRVQDLGSGEAGLLRSWSLYIVSNWD